jgi:BCCT family betaine/carnitine transporter
VKREAAQKSEIDRFVFGATILFVLATAIPLMIAPVAGGRGVDAVFAFITEQFGVVYLWAGILNLTFLCWLAFGRFGGVRLSRTDDPPEFNTYSWAAMLFCAGIGTGILYWGTIEWAYYFDAPPYAVAPGSPEAIEWATSYPIFHWGATGWAFYGLGQLRHCDAANGPKYGKCFKKLGILGVLLEPKGYPIMALG